jgi:hypothetical protein
MNFIPLGTTISNQIVSMPVRDRMLEMIDRIGDKLEHMTEDTIRNMSAEDFSKVLTTVSYVGVMWLGEHDPDVKELKETLADADIQLSLKKEIKAAREKGQQILP